MLEYIIMIPWKLQDLANCTFSNAMFYVVFVGDGVDINSKRRNAIFGRRRRVRDISININDDDIFEPLECVELSLEIPEEFAGIGLTLGINPMAIGCIIDDEGMHCRYCTTALVTGAQELLMYTQYAALGNCGVPEMPTNGTVDFNSTVEGSIANYMCNEGYILDGVILRICEESSLWSDSVPQCQRELIIIVKITYLFELFSC